MYETLEGRVKFEKTEQELKILVPLRPGPFAAVYGPLLGLWLVIAAIRYTKLLAGPHPEDLNFYLQMAALGIYIVGFVYFLGWVSWTLTGESMVTLNPPNVKISHRVFGVDISSTTYRTEEIHRMRFVPAQRKAIEHAVLNPNSSFIQFEVDGVARKFAGGISKDEARALIDRMLLVYEFPRSWF